MFSPFPTCRLLWLAALISLPAGSQTLTPAQQAKAAFDKVDSSALPALQDTMMCMQAHAALLPQVPAGERYLVHYRRGYCALMGASVTRDPAEYAEAAREFASAIQTWPGRAPQAVSSGLRVLNAIAVAGAGRGVLTAEAVAGLDAVVQQPDCSATAVMQPAFCQELTELARLWLGWNALQAGKLNDAAKLAAAVPSSPWMAWIAGRQAWVERRWPEALGLMDKAVQAWEAAEKSRTPRTADLLGPRPDLGRMYLELATAYYRSDQHAGVIAAHEAAVKRGAGDAYGFFMRARAREATGQTAAALEDYQRAATLAASNKDDSWAVGQAHYYRGLLLYGRRSYKQAQAEFIQAPKAGLGDIPGAEVNAWATLSAVAAGDCSKAPELLDLSVKPASKLFPAADAQSLAAACQLKQALTLDQLLEFEQKLGSKLDAAQMRQLRSRVADAYSAQGVAAEDRKDTYAAVIAYRKALEWDPSSSKARFNLGAIYLEDRKYDLAEGQYRALTQSHPDDFEAHYWLAESILAQPLNPTRKSEACELLKRSLAVSDPGKRDQFKQTFSSVGCR